MILNAKGSSNARGVLLRAIQAYLAYRPTPHATFKKTHLQEPGREARPTGYMTRMHYRDRAFARAKVSYKVKA